MKDMWNELGVGHLALSSQNLRDKAAALERIMGNVSGDIVRNVERANRIRSGRGNKENADIIYIVVENLAQNANEFQRRECTSWHTDSIQNQAEEIVNYFFSLILYTICMQTCALSPSQLISSGQGVNYFFSLILYTICMQTCALFPSQLISSWQRLDKNQSMQLFALVNTGEGDYSNCAMDMWIKQKPTQSDLKMINKVINGLLE